jgi:hypothetical protein
VFGFDPLLVVELDGCTCTKRGIIARDVLNSRL